jgi:hypothetical protein
MAGIPGAPGTDPQPAIAAEDATSAPPATPEPVAHIVSGPDGVFVEFDGRRVRLADEDIARLRGAPERPRPVGVPADLMAAVESARAHAPELLALPNVVAVRGGYKFVDDWITRTPAVIVAVDRRVDGLPASEQVPAVLSNGMPTDVAIADPIERLARAASPEAASAVRRAREPLLIDQVQGDGLEDEAEEAVPVITYEPPTGASLDPVTGAMTVTCHVSPEAGWLVLRPFIEGTREDVVLGMYDFTAPHIYHAVRSLLRDSDVVWRQTLGPHESLPSDDDSDSTKAGDLTESSIIEGLGRVAEARFENAFARVGKGRTFASAYHIKVAVRDRSATWLSSGNWQSSNQPAMDLFDANADRNQIVRFNREWHMVVEHAGLAGKFRRYLEHDLETARGAPEVAEEAVEMLPELLIPVDELIEEEKAAVGLEVFPPARFVFTKADPLTIQPILTPDNYLGIVLDLLRTRPKKRLYFQNQSLNPVKEPTPEWAELLHLLADYSNDPSLDVRMIIRDIGPIRKKLDSLLAAGFNTERLRVQPGCHTKGIVIDSSTVLIGSHNWTNQGVQANRDASLLIRNEEIAGYYERVFLHDWERLARKRIRPAATPIPVTDGPEAAAVDGRRFVRAAWTAWDEE